MKTGAFVYFVKLLRDVVVLGVSSTAVAHGGVVNLGVLSFDVLTPGGSSSPGVNVLDISNFTGDPASGGFALAPDFPSFTALTFESSELTLVINGIPRVIPLGDLAPGPLVDTTPLRFPDSVGISSATFSATLSTTTIVLSDGTIFQALSPAVNTVLLPSSGSLLSAGADFTVIAPNVPEPTTFGLVLTGVAALVGWLRSKKGAPMTESPFSQGS